MSALPENKTPFFSVIIPTFNRSQVLARAITSVLAQTFKDFELIVVDDGSEDETSQLLEKFPEIKYVKTENRGVSAARNKGVELATGLWFSFLDSDDEWLEHKLQRQFDFIQINSSIPIVHGEEIWIRKGKRVNPKKKHAKSGGHIFQKCLPLCLISPSAVCIRRDVYEEQQGFDEDYVVCEDYDLWLKLTSIYEVGFLEEPIINKYGGHEDQLSSRFKAMDWWRLKSMVRILQLRDLNEEDRLACLAEIKLKSEILLMGYEKHGKHEMVKEVKELIKGLEI